jgi:hypothetical protein
LHLSGSDHRSDGWRPPFIVALDEVGLTQGCKPVVRESRSQQSPTGDFERGILKTKSSDYTARMSEFAISVVILAVLMIGTAVASVLFRLKPSRRRGRSLSVILENAIVVRLITLVLGIPALYLLDYHVDHAVIYWSILVIVGVAGTYLYVRQRGKVVGQAMRKS